ncbi:MTMRB protein, partial [Nyctiprogne leucopyga]|nr:MTMRB protein [Nyctiprogne leucopyga]
PGSQIFLHSDYEVALPCIRKLVAASSFTKPKVLTAASTLKFIPEELAVFCRDFRLLRFQFPENGLAPQAFRVSGGWRGWGGDTVGGVTPSHPQRLCWHLPGGGDLLRAASFHAASEPGSEDVRWVLPRGPGGGSGGAAPTQPHPGGLCPPKKEPSDRDRNCLLASLVQLLGDPHSRTLPGFQSLIQREWVAAGHPFPQRLGLLRHNNPREEAPVFLLFLDCTWQLVRQFPADFGFTESYLLALHDSSFAPYFSTFLFSCQRQRDRDSPHRPHSQTYTPVRGCRDPHAGVLGGRRGGSCPLPMVWDWGLRYSRHQRARFWNPAAAAGTVGPPDTPDPQTLGRPPEPCPGSGSVFSLTKGTLSPQPFPWRSGRPPPRPSRWVSPSPGCSRPPEPPPGVLLPSAAGPSVRLWRRCYLRGLPEAQRGRLAPSPAGLAEELRLLQDRLSAWWAQG